MKFKIILLIYSSLKNKDNLIFNFVDPKLFKTSNIFIIKALKNISNCLILFGFAFSFKSL